MLRQHRPSVLPTLFPVADEPRDWTETACLILTAIGTGYFTGHMIVAFVRGAIS